MGLTPLEASTVFLRPFRRYEFLKLKNKLFEQKGVANMAAPLIINNYYF